MSDTPKLTRVQRLDSIKLDETYFTREGYLIDHPIVTSTGIFEYRNKDGSIRRELRLPEQVFDPESLATYEGKPVIITHHAGRVDKGNVDREIVGTILSKGYPDGDNVRAKIIIHNIDEVKVSGLRELSLGYDLILDETPGEWQGQSYDAIQTRIRINHLALVDMARAGDQARLNIDGQTKSLTGGTTMSENTKDMTTTNEQHQETPASSPADKLQLVKDRRGRRDQESEPVSTEDALGVIAQQDEDINSLLEMLEALQAKSDFDSTSAPAATDSGTEESTKTINADSIDAIIRERIKLGRIGDKLYLEGLEDMNPLEAKKAIIKKVNPGMRLDGKGEVYINAAFDVALSQMGTLKDTNFQRKQMFNSDGRSRADTSKSKAQQARETMVSRMQKGGK